MAVKMRFRYVMTSGREYAGDWQVHALDEVDPNEAREALLDAGGRAIARGEVLIKDLVDGRKIGLLVGAIEAIEVDVEVDA